MLKNVTQYTAHSNDLRINTIIWNILIISASVFIFTLLSSVYSQRNIEYAQLLLL